MPAGAQSQNEAPFAHILERCSHFCQQCGIAEKLAENEMPKLDIWSASGEIAHSGPCLKHSLFTKLYMVAHPGGCEIAGDDFQTLLIGRELFRAASIATFKWEIPTKL